MTFKKGDRVTVTVNCSGCEVGKVYVVSLDANLKPILWTKKPTEGCSCTQNWRLEERVNVAEETPTEKRRWITGGEGAMQVSKSVYKVLVVDKESDRVIVEAFEVASNPSAATAQVALKHAKDMAGKDLYVYASSIATYTKDVA